ncbi:MAG: phage terminase large subunit, partial [Methanosarcina sp.]|nr:phage terminase large subunit [Methanosarcina sp.]
SEEPLEEYDQRTGPDQALWPDEFPEVDLLSTKASSTVYEWLSIYQQRPSAAAGNLVKKENFKYCTLQNNILDLGDKKYLLNQCKIFQTCDPAASTKTSADYFALGTWALTPQNDLALIDLLKTRLETPDQLALFKQQYIKWRPIQQWVESRGLGISLYQALLREGLPVMELKADTDKVTRFIPAATRIATGTVYFLNTLPGLHDFEEELLSFPNGAHDDCVDVVSYGVTVAINGALQQQVYETSYIGTSFSSGSMRI